MADALTRDGYSVILGGFDNLVSIGAITLADISTAISYGDAVIFPLPSVRADGSLNTPFADEKYYLSDREQEILSRKAVLAGMADRHG